MKTIRIVIENVSELVLSKRETSTNFVESQSFIRGSRFYGAFGNYLIQENGLLHAILQEKQNPNQIAKQMAANSKEQKWFKQYFDSNSSGQNSLISFSDAIPVDKQYGSADVYFIPAPKILYECRKYENEYFQRPFDPRFTGNQQNHILLSLKNELIKRKILLNQTSTLSGSNLMQLLISEVCPRCGSPTKKKKAEFIKINRNANAQDYNIKTINISKSWKMGIARDESLKTVKQILLPNQNEPKGQLFSMQYVDPGQLFSLGISYDDTEISEAELLDIINKLKIGAKINSGFGDIKVRTDDPFKPKELRLGDIKTQIDQNYKKWIQDPELREYVPLYCISDVILPPELCIKEFQSIPGVEIRNVSSSKKIINLYYYNGLQSGIQTIEAFERGSVFLMYKKGGFSQSDLEQFAILCYQRIGLLKERGFGEIAILPDYFLM